MRTAAQIAASILAHTQAHRDGRISYVAMSAHVRADWKDADKLARVPDVTRLLRSRGVDVLGRPLKRFRFASFLGLGGGAMLAPGAFARTSTGLWRLSEGASAVVPVSRFGSCFAKLLAQLDHELGQSPTSHLKVRVRTYPDFVRWARRSRGPEVEASHVERVAHAMVRGEDAPPLLTLHGKPLEGANRVLAAQKLGWSVAPVAEIAMFHGFYGGGGGRAQGEAWGTRS